MHSEGVSWNSILLISTCSRSPCILYMVHIKAVEADAQLFQDTRTRHAIRVLMYNGDCPDLPIKQTGD